MKIRKSMGPTMVPGGIPWLIGNREDVHPFTFTHIVVCLTDKSETISLLNH